MDGCTQSETGRRPSQDVSDRGYPGRMDEPKAQVDALRGMLEAELNRRLKTQRGCWPLLVGVLGMLLGLALLAERL